MLSWKYFAQAKNSGSVDLLKKSCKQLTQVLSIRPDKNAIKLAINFSSYQHNFSLLENLVQYYLSYWPYDSQVHLWYLQAAIAQNRDKLIKKMASKLLSLPADLYTLLGKADLAGFHENFNARRQFLLQALDFATEPKTQAWLWLQLAVIHLDNQRDLLLAGQALIKAEQLDPNSAAIQRHHIEWLIFNGNKSLAQKKLTRLKQWHQHHELVNFEVMINTIYPNKPTSKLQAKHKLTVGHICQNTFNKFVEKS
jgi:hypothetical protein